MKTVTSISGGKTSAYLAANYPTDYLVFSLVRIEDKNCKFKDEKLRKLVEDKIQLPFIATAEDDKIIYTILDLEQFLGKKIHWVTGLTFDQIVNTKGGILPSKLRRYCTTHLKIIPIFQWWKNLINDPVIMHLGYRANEVERANKMLSKCNNNGFIEMKDVIGKSKNGRNKWKNIEWQMPKFPLIENAIYKSDIVEYWKNKPVNFAEYNNCVGCFHRNPVFLRFMFDEHPEKMNWFQKQEGGKKGYWKSVEGIVQPYEKIKKMLPQLKLDYTDFTSCDAGYCEL